ncbi:hypothetical protein HNP38_003560 [Chryseobacterium defluvii]|uniref:Uncharacterized protein n=1 Tax=Chryseobacterium defluvii TaxID=160396 RepID=A0A840KF77_9FLAO|nr:hypothetical protein [Chryseobacterium defluvii]MBB4808219.1 hypothetical protein [Chryseobacterium defluvii]
MSSISKNIFIGFAIAGGVFIVGCIIFALMIFSAFGGFDKSYSIDELKEEYLVNEKEIDKLIQYYYSIKPTGKIVEIEFKDDTVLERLRIAPDDATGKIYQQWDVNVENLTKPELKKDLGWSKEEIKMLKEKLDQADCISIEDGEPVKVGFKRSGLGMLSFNVFQKKETDRSDFNDGCQYILVNNKLALEYGGGAVGPQCFPHKQ